MKEKKRKNRVGLNSQGHVDWDSSVNLNCLSLVDLGFHGDVIADATGLSKGAVYYRSRVTERKLRDYRDGRSKPAKTLLRKFKVV